MILPEETHMAVRVLVAFFTVVNLFALLVYFSRLVSYIRLSLENMDPPEGLLYYVFLEGSGGAVSQAIVALDVMILFLTIVVLFTIYL